MHTYLGVGGCMLCHFNPYKSLLLLCTFSFFACFYAMLSGLLPQQWLDMMKITSIPMFSMARIMQIRTNYIVCWGHIARIMQIRTNYIVCWGYIARIMQIRTNYIVCWGHIAKFSMARIMQIRTNYIVCWGYIAMFSMTRIMQMRTNYIVCWGHIDRIMQIRTNYIVCWGHIAKFSMARIMQIRTNYIVCWGHIAMFYCFFRLFVSFPYLSITESNNGWALFDYDFVTVWRYFRYID